MKLHLPHGLRKALLVCLAALTVSLPATLGTASGWAAVAYIVSTRVYADFAGPQVNYTKKTWETEESAVSKMTFTVDTEVELDSGHPEWGNNGEARHEMEYVLGESVEAGKVNLKLTSSDANDTQYWFKNVGDFKSLWLDGVGRWFIKGTTESFSNKIEDIYVHGSQLYIDATAKEITDWTANIHIGVSTATGDEGAFVANQNVSTSGTLDVMEDAKITLGGNFTVGSISGTGKLEIGATSTGTLTIRKGGTVGGITMGAGGKMSLVTGTLSAGELNITEGGTLTLHNGATFDFSSIEGKLTINLAGFYVAGDYDIFGEAFDTWFSSHATDWNNYLAFTGLGEGLGATLTTEDTDGHKGWLNITGTLQVEDLTVGGDPNSVTISADGTYKDLVIGGDTTGEMEGSGLNLGGHTVTITGTLKGGGDDTKDDIRVNGAGLLVLLHGGEITGILAAFDKADIELGMTGGDAGVILSVGRLGGNDFEITTADNTHGATLKVTGTGGEALGGVAGNDGSNTSKEQISSIIGPNVTLELAEEASQTLSGVNVQGKVKLNANSTLTSAWVEWGGMHNILAGGLVGSGTLKVENSTLHLEKTAVTDEFTGTLDVGVKGVFDMSVGFSAGTVTLAEGAVVQMSGGTLKAGTLTLGDAHATLEMTLTGNSGPALVIGALSRDSGTLTIKLTGWDEFESTGYQLFDNADSGWSAFWTSIQNTWSQIFLFQDANGYTLDVELNGEGKLVSTAPPAGAPQTWKGGETEFAWTTESNAWSTAAGDSRTYDPSADVIFAGTNTELITVTVNSAVSTTQNMTVQKGENDVGGKYLFSITDGGITVDKLLTIEEGTEVEFRVTSGKTLKAGGTVVKGKMTIGGDDSTGSGNKSLGDVDIQQGGEVVIQQAWYLYGNAITNLFHGEGKLTFDLASYNASQNIYDQFTKTVGNSAEKGLNNFEFRNAFLQFAGDGDFAHLTSMQHLVVGANSCFLLDAPGTNTHGWGSAGLTIHLQGAGVKGGAEPGNGCSADAALSFYTHNAYNGTGGAASTVTNPWNFVLDDNATVRIGRDAGENNHAHVLQLKGTLDAGGHKLTKTGIGVLELTGTFATTGTTAGSSIDVTNGSLKLSYTNGEALQDFTVNLAGGSTLESGITGTVGTLTGGGTLKVTGGKLTLGTAEGATLTNLALGAEGAAGELVVNAGSFTISGGWTWEAGSKLTLGAQGQTVTLSGITDPGWSEGTKLTIHLSSAFMEGGVSGELVLFQQTGFTDGWEKYFVIETDSPDTYKDIQLTAEGKLTWTTQQAPEGGVFWGGGSDETELTWGEGGNNFDSQESGGDKTGWVPGSDVHFVDQDSAEHKVKLAADINAGAFEAKGGSPDAKATFSFVSSDGSTSHNLTVGGNMTATNADLTFDANVNLTVKGDVTLTDSTLTLSSDMVFTGSISGTGQVLNGNASLPAMVSSYVPTAAAAENTVFTLWDNGTTASVTFSDFESKFGSALGENVGYGVTVGETPLTITNGGAFARDFKLAQGDLTFDGVYTFNKSFTIGTEETDSVLPTATGGAQASVSHTGNLTISGGLVVKAGTEVTFKKGNGTVDAGVITLEEGAKLILQGAQTWTGTNNWTHYAAGDGEVVFQGMGVQKVEGSGTGILWAFTNNDEQEGHDLGGLRLSTWKGGGEGSVDLHTTLYILAEMGGPSYHGVANIANIWVEDGNSLVLGTAALGEPRNGSHQNSTLHLAGNGSNDAYDDAGNTADAALMLVDEDSGSNRRTIKWNIDITADTSISVTDGESAWTLGGKMYNSGSIVEKKGDQKLILGAGFTTAENADGGTGSGKWKVSAGTLELAYNATDTMSEWAVELAGGTLITTKNATLKALNGTGTGTLNVSGGTLTLTEGISGTLTELTLGDNAVLVATGGSGFTIEGVWHWGTGSTLKLGVAVALGDSVQLTDGSTQKLTIDLSSGFLGDGTAKGSKQLFTSGFNENWVDYFTFLVNGSAFGAGNYENLKLDANGMLTWGPAAAPGDTLYWGGGSNDGNVTLGTTSDSEWSHEQGIAGTEPWALEKEVVLEAASGEITVTVGDGATMKSLDIAAGATYTFTATDAQTLTVTDGITIGANTTFGENVGVKAGKLTISGENTVVEFSGAEGSVNVKGTLDNQVDDNNKVTGVMGDGGIVLQNGATLRLTSDVINGEKNYAYVQGDGTVDIDMSGDRTGVWSNWFGNLFPAVEYNKSTGSGITLQLTNSTHLTLEGHLGDRLQNVKTFNITGGSSVIVTQNVGGSDLFSLGKGHTLSIAGTGKDGAGALQFDAAETIAWNFVLTGDATISGTAATTLTGELDAATHTLTKSGTGELVLGTGFSTKEGSSGTLNVTEGTLKLNYGTSEALSGYTVQLGSGAKMESSITGTVKALKASGGTLNVSGGKLTLTELTLDGGAVLEVTGEGGFTIESTWHWGANSTLKLGAAVTLGDGVELTDGSTQKLTIDLSSSFLGGDGTTKGERQLFTSGFKDAWVDYFTFLVDGGAFGAGNYENLKLDTNGMLTWGAAAEPGDILYWGGGSNDGNVTLGTASDNEWSHVQGSLGSEAWAQGKEVVLEAASGNIIVTVGEGAEVSALNITTAEDATYTFTAEGAKTLTVTGGMTVGADATFGANVGVTAGTATVNSGTIRFESGSTLTAGKLTIGGADTVVEFGGAEGSVNVKGTLENQLSGQNVTGVTGVGGIVLQDGATLKLKGNVFSGLAYVRGDGTVDVEMGGDQTGAWNNWFGNLFPAVKYNESTGSGVTLKLTNSTHLTLAGNLGDRMQNVRTLEVTDGSSVIVTDNAGGLSFFPSGEGHTLRISGTGGEGGAGALQFGAAETIAWNVVLTGDATISGAAETTLTGELDAATRTLTKKGAGDLVLGEGFSTKEGSSGTLNVTEGALKLNYGTSDALSGYAVQLGSGVAMESSVTGAVKSLAGNGGTLNVSGGRLTLTGGISGSLTELTLGDNATLEVAGGSGFTIEGAWHWGNGSTLKLGVAVALGGSVELTDGSTQKLTIDLSSGFLGDGTTRGEKQLFTGFQAGWESYFTFLVNGGAFGAGNYENLQLDGTGKLTWGKPAEPGDILYWGVGDADNTLTLGTGGNEWSHTKGEQGTEGWEPGKEVVLESDAAGGVATVKVAEGGATMKTLTLVGTAVYNFTADAAQTVTVTGSMSNSTDFTVGEHVTLSVGGTYSGNGDVTVNGGLLKLDGRDNIVGGDVTVEGATVDDSATPNIGILFGGATVIEGEFHLTGETGLYNSLTLKQGGTVSGTFHVSWDGHLTLGDDLVVGNLGRGTASETRNRNGLKRTIDREGSVTDRNVYILFSEEGGQTGNLNAMYDAFRAKANGETNHETIGEGVGYGIAGKDAGSNVTLSLAETSETGYDFKIRGGRVTLGGGTALTVGTADAGKTLELVGATLVLGDHTLSAGTLIVGGKSTISLNMGEQTAGVLSLGGLSFGSDGSLTIQLADFTAGDTHEDFLLFGEGSSWLTDALIGKFSFVDSSGTAIDDVTLRTTGVLTWGATPEPGPGGDTEPGGDVFWGGGEDESDLTWGDTSHDFDSQEDGGSKTGWTLGSDVHFVSEDAKERNVKLAGDIEAGNFEARGTGAEGKAKFSFGSEGKKGLTVGGNMSVTHAELTFTKDVDLTVDGSVTLTESTLSVEGEAEFKGEVSGTGTLDTGTGGKISLSRTGEGGFKGKVTGTGTLATSESGQVTLSGDVSGFEGTLDIGADGTLTLSGDAVGDEVSVKAGGSGTLAVDGGDADVTFSGTVGGVTLKNAGNGELTVTSQVEGNGSGTKLDGGKGGITLGGTGSAAVWNGEEVTGGDITLSNVTLAEGGLKKATAGAKVYVDTALVAGINTVAREATLRGGIVDVKGMDAGRLDGITVNAHGQLTEVTGTYKVGANKQLTLHFTAENVVGSGAEKGLIVGRHIEGKEDFNIEFSGSGEAEEQGLRLEFDEAAIIEALRRGGESEVELLAIQGGTWKTEGVTIDWTKLGLMDIYVTGVEFTDVGLKIAGSTRDLYVVLDGEKSDSHESKAPADMAEKLATVVTAGQTLTLNWAEDGTVRNLVGAEGAKLEIKDASGQGLTVTLDNTHYDMVHDDRYPTTEDAKGEDTTFVGAIDGGKGVDIVKSGLGTLTVGGDYTLADGDTRLEAGALSLSGTGNRMKSLTFAYGTAPGAGEERGLLLAAGSRTELGSIVEDPKAGSSVGNEVTLSGNAELTLTGESTLANTAISSDDAHGGVLRLAEGASLSFTGDKGISDTAVEMKNAVLDLGASKSTLTELNGSGTLKSATGGEVKVGGGTFTGTLGSSAESEGAGTLVVAGEFTLDKVASAGDAKMGVRMEGKSHLTVKAGEKQGDGTDTLNFGDIELGGGRLTVDFGGRGINGNYVTGNVIGVGEDGVLEFVSNGAAKGNTIYTGFTVADGLQGQVDDFVKFSGVDNLLNDYTVGVEGREVVLTLQAVEENRLAGLIPGAQKNGLAGAEMMWGSLKGRSQGELLSEIFARPDSAYARLAFYLSQCYGGNADATGLDRTLAAAAGSAISTLGAALGQDVHRQLSTIRNRTTGMGGAAHEADDKLPQWHAWIQGEGNYHKLDADGLAPGYTLNSWGGTVGVDADVTRRMTLGLAVTAMYGDLKPDSPDSATGDLDTAYLSAFARVAHGAWIHTFAVSGGFADVKLDRTVSYNGGSYRTSGSTDGYALGVLYEVGYTRLMNAAGTVALQPVFNMEWRHASIDGYTESGCDAGVNTDDITQDVVTFGAGARAQFAVGANAFNHAAVLETRALVKADVGDRSGTANNAMVGDTARAEVESAEVGAVGVELGAGISVPVGSDTGSVFVDGSVEFRSGWTSANATVGYRMNF